MSEPFRRTYRLLLIAILGLIAALFAVVAVLLVG